MFTRGRKKHQHCSHTSAFRHRERTLAVGTLLKATSEENRLKGTHDNLHSSPNLPSEGTDPGDGRKGLAPFAAHLSAYSHQGCVSASLSGFASAPRPPSLNQARPQTRPLATQHQFITDRQKSGLSDRVSTGIKAENLAFHYALFSKSPHL